MYRPSHGSKRLVRLCWSGGIAVGLSLLLAGCPGKEKPTDTSQIAAQVNDSEISVHQVSAALESQPGLAERLGEAGPKRVLDSLIDQELAAQEAKRNGLDTTPHVLQAMELAKREVLARAYQDQLAEKVVMPDSEAVDRYYEAHPELFAKRRQYTLQETLVRAPADKRAALAELRGKVEKQDSAEAINALVNESGLPHSSRNSMQWAEGLPMDLLPQLAYLKVGQSVVIDKSEGLLILTLLNAIEAPLTRSQAGNAIQAAMMASSRRELVQKGMEALRQKAKIQRMGPFASGAAAASSTPASSTP